MTEFFLSPETESDEEIYLSISAGISSLFLPSDNILSNLSNFTALIKQSFKKVSWAGFYLFDGKKLFLGPFQGKIACTNIEIGRGVCGTSAERRKTLIVEDVENFPGHIACDPDSKSEIVVPVFMSDGSLFGVLDLDSNREGAFGVTDKKYLEELINYFEKNLIPAVQK